MSTELLDDLMKRSAGLTADEKKSLARFLAAQTRGYEVTASKAPQRSDPHHAGRREQHMRWLKLHREEYSGQYVALDGDELMGHGRTIKEAAQQAKENGCKGPFLVYVLSSSVVAEGGL
jgi:Family of unknown function (DUF5678)